MTRPIENQPSTFAQRVKIERERMNLTQTEFGHLGGVSKMAQWQYEQGRHSPSMDYIDNLRNAEVDVAYLVTGSRIKNDRLEWDVLRDAYLFVHRSFVSRKDRHYTDEQLFDAFKSVVEAAMGLTRNDLPGGLIDKASVGALESQDGK